MDHYETEEQQWEAIKRWFKRHGDRITWGLIIVLSIVAGGNYWRHHRKMEAEKASDQYTAYLITVQEKDGKGEYDDTRESSLNAVFEMGEKLIREFPKSPYASLVALQLAKESANQQQWDKVDHYLRWVMTKGTTEEFQALGRTRLMQVMATQNQGEEALKLFDEKKASGFLTEMAEIKGDILLQQNDTAGAIKAYTLAYESASNGFQGPLLTMKMENVGIDVDALKRQKDAVKKEAENDQTEVG